MLKPFIFTSSLVAVIGMLSGCTPPEPTQFGMAQSQFQQLPSDQQSQVIDNYGQQQQLDSQEAALENVVGTVTQAIGSHKSVPAASQADDSMAQMQAQAAKDQAAFLQQAANDPNQTLRKTGHYESNTTTHHSSMSVGFL